MDTHDDLATYLSALERDSCYRADALYKESRFERTERVFFVGENGAELGPFVRKTIREGLGRAYEVVAAAQREGVRLPHLPRIVECFRRDEDLVVVMEHVRGKTLEALVAAADGPAARLDLVRRVFPDLCDAAVELHESLPAPLIHRDLKPGNVMVSSGGVTLIDLGIARAFKEGAEQDTTRFGTRAYAPPEQFGFGQTGVTSDVYALGMVLFFCLVGREPTSRDREAGFRDAAVPEPLRTVIARATELDPVRRFPTVRDLREVLLAALEACPVGEKYAGLAVIPAPDAPAPPPAPAPAVAEPPVFESSWSPRTSRRAALLALAERVPEWVGFVWSVLVLTLYALFVMACVSSAINPTPSVAHFPAWYRVVTYIALMAPALGIIAYLLLDRRLVRRYVPALSRLTIRQELRWGGLAIAAIFAVWVVISFVARPG